MVDITVPDSQLARCYLSLILIIICNLRMSLHQVGVITQKVMQWK